MSEIDKHSNLPRKTGRRRVIEWTVLVLIVAVLAIMVYLSVEANRDETVNVDNTTDVVQEDNSEEAIIYPALHEEYRDLSEDTVFIRASENDVVSTLSEGTGVVFLGFPGCPWCQGLAPVVDQAAKNVGLNEVKYLDILEHRQNQTETYLDLVSLLGEYLPVGDDGQKNISVPDMTIVRDGQVVYRYEPEVPSEQERTPDSYWTEDRTDRVRQELEGEFRTLVDL